MNNLINSSEIPENFNKLLYTLLEDKPNGTYNIELNNSQYCAEVLGLRPVRFVVNKQGSTHHLLSLSYLNYVYEKGLPALKEFDRFSIAPDDSFVNGNVKYNLEADPMAKRIIKNRLAVIAGFLSENLFDSYNVTKYNSSAKDAA